MPQFQLTRSVGSVTIGLPTDEVVHSFQLTRSVGSVTSPYNDIAKFRIISTHTLRGERDELQAKA